MTPGGASSRYGPFAGRQGGRSRVRFSGTCRTLRLIGNSEVQGQGQDPLTENDRWRSNNGADVSQVVELYYKASCHLHEIVLDVGMIMTCGFGEGGSQRTTQSQRAERVRKRESLMLLNQIEHMGI